MFGANQAVKIVQPDGSTVYVNPIAGYAAANMDVGGPPNYYGFINTAGEWYILKEVVAGNVTTYTYVSGTSAYATAWTGRAALSYVTFDNAF